MERTGMQRTTQQTPFKRTTVLKLKRTNKALKMKRQPIIKDMCGGFMPFPPKDQCPISNRIVHNKQDGVWWIDNVICASRCRSYCDRRIEYDAIQKEKRKRNRRQPIPVTTEEETPKLRRRNKERKPRKDKKKKGHKKWTF